MIDISPAQIQGSLGGTDDPARKQAVSDKARHREADKNTHSTYTREWEQDYPAATEISISCNRAELIDPPKSALAVTGRD